MFCMKILARCRKLHMTNNVGCGKFCMENIDGYGKILHREIFWGSEMLLIIGNSV